MPTRDFIELCHVTRIHLGGSPHKEATWSGKRPPKASAETTMAITTLEASATFGSRLGVRGQTRGIGHVGRASGPHRSLPLGPGRLSGSPRVRSAAGRLGSPPQEARLVRRGAVKAALPTCGSHVLSSGAVFCCDAEPGGA